MTEQNLFQVRAAAPRWQQARKIVQFIHVSGMLTLLTPASFGGGEKTSSMTDMPLLLDAKKNCPLLPGTSIAGAMRAYLMEWELGYEKKTPAQGDTLAQKLFGVVIGGDKVQESEKESHESYLIIEDAQANVLHTEFRPGVKINPATRTVASDERGFGQLYETEFLEAGTQFEISLELALPDDENLQKQLKEALAVALSGFETDRREIELGRRKRRGFGECEVAQWEVETFDLRKPSQLVAWLRNSPGEIKTGSKISELLGVSLPPDQRKRFCLDARFRLDGSLLIRSANDDENLPDMAHLKSKRPGKRKPELKPVLSGTSLAGAVRARALKIAKTVTPENADKLVEELFGPSQIIERSKRKAGDEPKASRAVVRERVVENCIEDRVQTRIRIDRFTGGTYPGALFEQQPVLGKKDTQMSILIDLRNPSDAQIGLLLQVLKDLWTGDLPLGGEAGVGRGRLVGVDASLSLNDAGKTETWRIKHSEPNHIEFEGDRGAFERFADALAPKNQEAKNEPEA